MWKARKEEEPQKPVANATPGYAAVPPKEVRPVDVPKYETRNEVAHIGKSVIIKGELSGSEDLYLDGEVEGTIELHENSLTVGPNGRIRAHVHAKEVIVHGKVDGNIRGNDRVELKRSAVLVGDIVTQRVSIEDGAYFKGSIDIQREAKPEPKTGSSYAAAASTPSGVAMGAPAMAEKK
ncbi:MAG: bactofilin family protein [Terriglobales bacterium]